MNDLNKYIVITGGTSGIGLETVRKLAASNQMIVISRSGVLPAEMSSGRFPVRLYHANLASKAEIELTVDQIQREFPVIDVLINNAAVQCTPGFLSDNFNYDAIQTDINVNLSAVCHLCYLLCTVQPKVRWIHFQNHSAINLQIGLCMCDRFFCRWLPHQ